jgi:hypothetical protein
MERNGCKVERLVQRCVCDTCRSKCGGPISAFAATGGASKDVNHGSSEKSSSLVCGSYHLCCIPSCRSLWLPCGRSLSGSEKKRSQGELLHLVTAWIVAQNFVMLRSLFLANKISLAGLFVAPFYPRLDPFNRRQTTFSVQWQTASSWFRVVRVH